MELIFAHHGGIPPTSNKASETSVVDAEFYRSRLQYKKSLLCLQAVPNMVHFFFYWQLFFDKLSLKFASCLEKSRKI